MKIAVTGGRNYDDKSTVYAALDSLRPTHLILGDASGADTLALHYALDYGVFFQVFGADWDKWGKTAGPIRNGEMIHIGKPDCLAAFPGGWGTKNCKWVATNAGVPVINY